MQVAMQKCDQIVKEVSFTNILAMYLVISRNESSRQRFPLLKATKNTRILIRNIKHCASKRTCTDLSLSHRTLSVSSCSHFLISFHSDFLEHPLPTNVAVEGGIPKRN